MKYKSPFPFNHGSAGRDNGAARPRFEEHLTERITKFGTLPI
jgi:hypothetical protein